MSTLQNTERSYDKERWGEGPKQETPSSILQNLHFQFEKANIEQGNIVERVIALMEKLNQTQQKKSDTQREVPPIEKERLTVGEGILPHFENLLTKYQEMIRIQDAVVQRLETFI